MLANTCILKVHVTPKIWRLHSKKLLHISENQLCASIAHVVTDCARPYFCAEYRTHLQTDLCNILFMWTQYSWQYKKPHRFATSQGSWDEWGYIPVIFGCLSSNIWLFDTWGECGLNCSALGFSLENFQKFNAYIFWVEIKNECKVLDHGCLNILSTLKNLKLKLSSNLGTRTGVPLWKR